MKAGTSDFPQISSRFVAFASIALAVACGPAEAQNRDRSCDDDRSGRDEHVCEVREFANSASGSVTIEGGMNGGARVFGSSRSDVRIQAEVWAHARTEARAEEIAEEVRISTEGNRLRAEGPDTRNRESWGVSWTVEVPTRTDVDIDTHNGGITIDGVDGQVRFQALNGGVRLSALAGDVEGRTTNGGLRVTLDGQAWDGVGMDVETTNGGVVIEVPDGYSADLETGTVNGRLELDIPVMVRGRIDRRLRTQLGDGGPRVRAVTTNGSVSLRASG